MEKWVLYALASMFFAGFTSVIAKMGLAGISADLGLTIRTLFVALFVIASPYPWFPQRNSLTLRARMWSGSGFPG